MVAVVGRLFQKWFPAQPNLSYTYIWDKTDAYGQRVYGLSEAVGEFRLRVRVGGVASSWGGFMVIHVHMSGFTTAWLKFLPRLLNKRRHDNV